MNRQIRRVAATVGVLMLALLINLNYVQVVKGGSYRNNPNNQRTLLTEYSSPRGQIIIQNGVPIAESVATSDELKYLRQYPDGPLYAPITGYYSLVYGLNGIEQTNDSILSGTDSRLFGSRVTDLLTGRNPTGGSVVLTINGAAQQAAYKAMAKQRGAVVAINPNTGAILAAVSLPSYDPNKLSSHDTSAIASYWQSLDPNSTASALTNRAFQATYPPGSVFKVIVSAAALKAGYNPNTTIPAPDAYWPLGGSGSCPQNGQAACVENFDGETCQNGTTASLEFALAKSCNTAFAELGVKLGGPALSSEAQSFGLDTGPLSVPLTVAGSTIGLASDLSDKAALAQTSFGQRDVRITPLQGAMIASAVADNGTLMQPYLVAQERAPDLSAVSTTKPKVMSQILDPTVNAQLQQMMVNVVNSPYGTGGAAQIQGVTVGGKTGTADTGVYVNGVETAPDAWFVGYAQQNGKPKIAVAVIIENGGVNGNEVTGGLAAAPVAKAVMEAYLASGAGS